MEQQVRPANQSLISLQKQGKPKLNASFGRLSFSLSLRFGFAMPQDRAREGRSLSSRSETLLFGLDAF